LHAAAWFALHTHVTRRRFVLPGSHFLSLLQESWTNILSCTGSLISTRGGMSLKAEKLQQTLWACAALLFGVFAGAWRGFRGGGVVVHALA